MKRNFSYTMKLPEYLEEALAPFSWSGIFSDDFRTTVSIVICSDNVSESVEDFIASVSTLGFLSKSWKRELFDALRRYAKERVKREKEMKKAAKASK